jgi:hypothetical protein
MNFNKCERCGCFFVTEGNTCPSCSPKDTNDIEKLNNYFIENENNTISLNQLSSITGISTKNISRYMTNKDFNYKKYIEL